MRHAILAISLVGSLSAHSIEVDVTALEREYPPEIFDYCMYTNTDLSSASRCMRDEAKLRRELEAQLRRQIRDEAYRNDLYQTCVDANYLEGTARVSRCTNELLLELDRVTEALAYIKKEIKTQTAQLKLMSICFEDYDASPRSLQTFQGKTILHCVKTKAYYYRLHGRF